MLTILFVVLSADLLLGATSNWVVPQGEFGPFKHGTYPSLKDKTHVGVDIIARSGSEVYPFDDGVVVEIISQGDKRFSWAGHAVMIMHPPKPRKTYTIYLHLAEKPLASPGQEVEKGKTLIGRVGHTGAANDVDHVHFEIRYFREWLGPGGNIYLDGDQRRSEVLKTNWDDPVRLFAEQAVIQQEAPSSSVSTAHTRGELTRPSALEVLKKGVRFYDESNCLFLGDNMKYGTNYPNLMSEEEGGRLTCQIKDPQVTGIAKTNPNETLVEFELPLLFSADWAQNKLEVIRQKKKTDEDICDRAIQYPWLLDTLTKFKCEGIEGLERVEALLAQLSQKPVILRKGQAQLRLRGGPGNSDSVVSGSLA
jgi:hypothetical protein